MKGVGRMASIYNPKTRFLIVDIETPKEPNSVICDLAFGIWSRKEGKLGSAGYLVQENRAYKAMYHDSLYDEYLAVGLYQEKLFTKIMDFMDRIIDKYEPTFATAYNSGFDFTRIRNECSRQGIFCPIDRLIEFDLMRAACETIGQQKTFKRWTTEKSLFTKKGNRSSSAETFYRYIKLNEKFNEEHTGLADIEIEMKILEKVLRQKKKMSMLTGGNAWKLVQG